MTFSEVFFYTIVSEILRFTTILCSSQKLHCMQEEKLIESSAGLFLENDNDEDAEDPDESLGECFE